MAKFPCSVCSNNCDDLSIFCDTCKTWSHNRCQDIDRTDRDQWRHNVKLQYICVRCRTNDDGTFDYLMAMERLRKASVNGFQKLQKAAEREKMFVKDVAFETSLHSEFSEHEQDQISNTLLAHCHTTDKTALYSTPDGDCFFSSVSILLCGNESRSTEMRYRCCLEMVLNKSKLMMHSQFKRLTIISPDFDTDCLNCARPGTYSSMHMFLAMSRLLNLPIQVFYPAVNGTNNYNFKTMNIVLRPPFADPDMGTLNLMWTSLSLPTTQPTSAKPWNPNHIVPLVVNVPRGSIHTMPSFVSWNEKNKGNQQNQLLTIQNRYQHLDIDECNIYAEDGENRAQEQYIVYIHPPQDEALGAPTVNYAEDEVASTDGQHTVGNHPVQDQAPEDEVVRADGQHSVCIHPAQDKALGAPTVNYAEDEVVSADGQHSVGIHPVQDEALGAPTVKYAENDLVKADGQHSVGIQSVQDEALGVPTDNNTEGLFKPGPLGTKFMDIGEIIKVMGGPFRILDEVPAGRKDGNYYIINNKLNNERRSNGKKSEFWDDCGSWSKGTSPTFTFLNRGGKLTSIQNRSGIFCIEKQKEKKKFYEPLEPQPSYDEILIIKRLYNILSVSEKSPTQFKRKCTWIENIPTSMPDLSLDIAVVEYVGTFPERKPHGNSIIYKKPYIRTKPNVKVDLKQQLKSQPVKNVMTAMNKNTKDDFSKQRNTKQLRNLKYNQNKMSDNAPSNAADQIMYVEEMVKTHDLVYSVKHIKGLQHPVITLQNEQQITDLKRFCGTGRTVLGVDKTYNLGEFHVTPTVYKDLSVLRESNGQHPVTLGPTFIHTNSSAKAYSSFFHDIADNLSQDELNNLIIGSNGEEAIKVAIDRCLPGATHTLCTRQLRQNTDNYLKDQVGYPKSDRQQIINAIYGEEGLTYAEDIHTYNFRFDRLTEKIQSLDNNAGDEKFLPYFLDKLAPVLKSYVIDPANKGKFQRGWSNNSCESANHVLKSVQWKHSDIPKFINILNDIVTGEVVERCRAIRGMGDYELDSTYIHHRVDIDRWSNMTEECRNNSENKFLLDEGKLNQNIISTNGFRTVQRTPITNKKPRQLKRKRGEIARTPPAKRVLLA